MIFLDVDGPLVDFAGGAALLHGYDLDSWPLGIYNMIEVLGLTDDEFWAPIHAAGADWWVGLSLMPWARQLIDFCANQPGGFALTTSPSHHPSSAAGKMAWMHSMFGTGFRDYMIGSPKHLLARTPNAMLIDDFESNCKIFLEDRFGRTGGQACLFPARWNCRHFYHRDPLPVVTAEVLALRRFPELQR